MTPPIGATDDLAKGVIHITPDAATATKNLTFAEKLSETFKKDWFKGIVATSAVALSATGIGFMIKNNQKSSGGGDSLPAASSGDKKTDAATTAVNTTTSFISDNLEIIVVAGGALLMLIILMSTMRGGGVVGTVDDTTLNNLVLTAVLAFVFYIISRRSLP
jgi:hypothetical protein